MRPRSSAPVSIPRHRPAWRASWEILQGQKVDRRHEIAQDARYGRGHRAPEDKAAPRTLPPEEIGPAPLYSRTRMICLQEPKADPCAYTPRLEPFLHGTAWVDAVAAPSSTTPPKSPHDAADATSSARPPSRCSTPSRPTRSGRATCRIWPRSPRHPCIQCTRWRPCASPARPRTWWASLPQARTRTPRNGPAGLEALRCSASPRTRAGPHDPPRPAPPAPWATGRGPRGPAPHLRKMLRMFPMDRLYLVRYS